MNIKIIEANIEQLDSITKLFNQYMIFYKKPSNETKYKAYLKERIGFTKDEEFYSYSYNI